MRGARVGLLCHPASVDARLTHALDVLSQCDGFSVGAVYGPQHGFLGNTQDNMIEWNGFTHTGTGLPVFSLYSETRKPAPEMLEPIDVLVCDLQDVGTRVYTFIWTMMLCLEACAEQGRAVVVLDRPNPIGGTAVEGNVLDAQWRSFVGLHPVPMRHGMTIGEIAHMVNREADIGCDLHVVRMRGWRRGMQFENTGLPWVLPSPNMPTPDTARVYPGTVIFEGTNLSEGRGATRPFELIGAPWIQAEDLAGSMNARGLPGAFFRPAYFEPVFHKGANQVCGGVQIHVLDAAEFKPYLTALALLRDMRAQDTDRFAWKQPPYEYEYERLPIDMILGASRVREQLEQGVSLEEMERSWQPELQKFMDVREKYLMYE